jgi:hypothetical protein
MPSKGKVGEEHWGAETSYRARRLQDFVMLVDQVLTTKPECRVLDVGGNASYWRDLEPVWRGRNLHVTLVNQVQEPDPGPPFEAVQGDARDLGRWDKDAFDVVHSNSVLEHVGRWRDIKATVAEIRRLAPRYFVQTPYYWFPLEPHFRVPFFNWLPEPWRLSIVMARGCGAFPRAQTVDDAVRFIEDSNLLDMKRFRVLFPDAEIRRERVWGLTKSLIAIR